MPETSSVPTLEPLPAATLPQRNAGEGAEAGAAALALGTDSFFQPRRAAFWLLVLLLVNGGLYMAPLFYNGVRVVPVTALLGLVVWSLYTWAFLWAFRTFELLEQRPPESFALAFAWGGLGAAHLAVLPNVAIQSLAAKIVSPEFAVAWGPALAGPITEEFLKLVGVVLMILVARNQFRTELSILIVGAMVGLGFQVVENLSYTIRAAINFPLEDQIAPVLLNLFTRGVLSGLWSHAAYTTIASYGVAYFLIRTARPLLERLGVAVLCFAFAWGMHFAWNSPWLEDSFSDSTLGLALLLIVKGSPALIAAAVLGRSAMREQGNYLHALASYFVPERDLLRDDEWMRLGSPLDRRRVRRELGIKFGPKARRLKHRLQREQLRLVLLAGTYGRGPQTRRREAAIRRTRAQLDALTGAPPITSQPAV